jgi:hypothetical protein
LNLILQNCRLNRIEFAEEMRHGTGPVQPPMSTTLGQPAEPRGKQFFARLVIALQDSGQREAARLDRRYRP